MSKKILHIADCVTFIPPFINLVYENFHFDKHIFLLRSGPDDANIKKSKNVYVSKNTIFSKLKHYSHAYLRMHQADKIILHGLFDTKLVFILFFTPWLLKKC